MNIWKLMQIITQMKTSGEHQKKKKKMLNYKIVENNELFEVIETSRDNQVIGSFPTKDEAKKFCRHLNLGGGFDGYTPSFLTKELK